MTDASLNAGSYDIPNQTEFDDYFALLKPRVMSLVVFTASVGMLAAPVGVHPIIAFASILFIAIGAGASGALNMWMGFAECHRQITTGQEKKEKSTKASQRSARKCTKR